MRDARQIYDKFWVFVWKPSKAVVTLCAMHGVSLLCPVRYSSEDQTMCGSLSKHHPTVMDLILPKYGSIFQAYHRVGRRDQTRPHPKSVLIVRHRTKLINNSVLPCCRQAFFVNGRRSMNKSRSDNKTKALNYSIFKTIPGPPFYTGFVLFKKSKLRWVKLLRALLTFILSHVGLPHWLLILLIIGWRLAGSITVDKLKRRSAWALMGREI